MGGVSVLVTNISAIEDYASRRDSAPWTALRGEANVDGFGWADPNCGYKTTLGFSFSCIFYAGTGKGYVKVFGFRTLRIYNKLTRQAHHRID